jgi:hypothetical protein
LIKLNPQIASLKAAFQAASASIVTDTEGLMSTLTSEPVSYSKPVPNKDQIVQIMVGYLDNVDGTEPDSRSLLDIIVIAVLSSIHRLPMQLRNQQLLQDSVLRWWTSSIDFEPNQ